jgi:ABC-type uncharacterized transport system permease subunit
MNYLLQASLAAYIVSAIHAWLAFANKGKLAAAIADYTLLAGFILHLLSFVTEWSQTGAFSMFGLHETLSFLAFSLVVIYGVMKLRSTVKSLAVFLVPTVSVLVFFALLIGTNPNSASQTNNDLSELNWIWLSVHIALWVLGYAFLFVTFVASLMYLVQEKALKEKNFGAWFHQLPPLSTVNEIASQATFIGFSLLTIGILTGILLSWQRDKTIWHNDIKEILALATWFLYLVLTIYRVSADWRGRRAAWLGIFGFGLILLTFFGARMLDSFHAFG